VLSSESVGQEAERRVPGEGARGAEVAAVEGEDAVRLVDLGEDDVDSLREVKAA
jgi:hypothetical protein